MKTFGRTKHRGLVYLRRSSGRQETSLETQRTWACAEAQKHEVTLEATQSDLQHMQMNKLNTYKDIRLDDSISGADLNRAGFNSLLDDAQADKTISHIFIYKRDRLGRPEEAMDFVGIEKRLTQSGITIVLSSGVALPRLRGDSDVGADLGTFFEYYESGEFLKKLADRIVVVQQHLAHQGYWTGGRAPYGFGRVLVDGSGKEIEELVPGRFVKQPGCHVKIKPKDWNKIKVWLYILELAGRGWGRKRIAGHLNALGIPSPGAGTLRTDHGVKHEVSGRWRANTIKELCLNQAILGQREYGRRVQGTHRRSGVDGPRLLDETDRTADGKPRPILTDPSIRTTGSIGFEPLVDVREWQGIQQQSEERGRSSRGIPRARDRAKYPLTCRVFDLTDGCGSIMHGITNGDRRIYECGEYRRTEGANCHHNVVDAEALLKFVQHSLRQLVDRQGGREQLRELLFERARRQTSGDGDGGQSPLVQQLQERVATLEAEVQTVQRHLAREHDDLVYETLKAEFRQIIADRDSARLELGRQQQQVRQDGGSPEEQVDLALAVYDDILRIVNDPAARAEIPELLAGMGMRVGLNFVGLTKGSKRQVRRLVGGIVAFGDHPLPVAIHGARNREPDPNTSPPSRKQLRTIENQPGSLRKQGPATKHHASDQGNVCPTGVNTSDSQKSPGKPGRNQRESVSSTKGHLRERR